MEIESVSKGVKTTHELPDQPLSLIIHQQGIRVNVPTADLYIDGVKTVNTVQQLNQRQWQHISTGPLFNHLFRLVFPTGVHNFEAVEIPKTVEELAESDFGVQHVCGLIIMLCEAVFDAQDKKKPLRVFIREVEAHLHPATQQYIMELIKAFIGGTSSEQVVEESVQDA